MMASLRWRTAATLALLALGFVLFVAVIDRLLPRVRLDLTQDRLFTLSQGTRNTLSAIDEPVTLTFTFSDRAATGVPRLKAYARRVADLLGEIEAASGGKVVVRQVDPEPFSQAEDEAVAGGLQPVPLDDGRTLLFGLVGTGSGKAREVISMFTPEREPQLEYDLTRLLYRLNTPELPRAALLTSLPMAFGPGGALAAAQGQSAPYAVYQQLHQFFDLKLLDPAAATIPAGTGVLVIAHPPALSTAQLYAIDQFVLRGGRLLVLVDPLSETGIESAALMRAPPPAQSDLNALMKPWGATLVPEKVVADLAYAQHVDVAGGRSSDYPVWLGLTGEAFEPDDPLSASVTQLNLASAGSLRLDAPPGVTASALIRSSGQSQLLDVGAVLAAADPAALMQSVQPGGARIVLAARLSGLFPSAFGDRPPVRSSAPHLARASVASTVVVIADADLLEDRFWLRQGLVYGAQTAEPLADNGAFIMNAIDTLTGSTDLLTLRTRGTGLRPFTVINAMRQKAEIRLVRREAALRSELDATEQRIRSLETGGGGRQGFLTPAQKAEIDRFRARVATTRLELRAVQRDLRRDVDRLIGWLTALNTLTVPLLLLAGWLAWFRVRRARRPA